MTEFERFFAEQFPKMLERVGEIGDGRVFTSKSLTIQECSWDRKAAYLIWRLTRTEDDDLI